MKTYLALTIGPVIKILKQARKTRELWAASIIQSSLMQYLVQNLDPPHPTDPELKNKHLLIPQIPQSVQQATLYGAGIYPDRLFMEADHLSEAQVETAIRLSLEDLARDCLLPMEYASEIDAAVSFWKQFFRIRYVRAKLADIEGGKLSSELSPVLDTLELEDTCFPTAPSEDYLGHLFETKRLFQCGLVQGLRGKNRGNYHHILTSSALFPATHEIAAVELFHLAEKHKWTLENTYDEDDNEKFYQKLDEPGHPLNPHFKPRHKYFCIVQADGDNISQVIKKLDDAAAYRTFSETLAEYGKDAAGIINCYGGKPIYIGGDDLLFLAPVRTAKGSVFDLIRELNKAFPKDKLHATASLSFGLNIVYYKFPLFEAIDKAYGILKAAKDFNREQKDAISFRFTKHSGNYFEGTFSKNFLNALADAVAGFESEGMDKRAKMVSSLIFKLFTLNGLIDSVAAQVQNDPDEFGLRIKNIFHSFFNEWGADAEFARQRSAAENLLLQAYREKDAAGNDWLRLFYAGMRLIQFIVSPSEKHQYDPEDIAATA